MSVSQPPRVKINPTMHNPTMSQINDPVVKLLNDQIAEALKNPEKALEMVDLHSSKKFVFRTRPNTVRQLQIRIPGLPESERNKEEVGTRKNYGAEFEKIYKRRHTAEQADYYEELVNRVGDMYITFTTIPQRHECFYETDDEMVADFIRDRIMSGKQPYLFEDRGVQYVRSRYTEALFADNEEGRQQRYIHDTAYERAIKDQVAKLQAEPVTTEPDEPVVNQEAIDANAILDAEKQAGTARKRV